MKKLLAGLMFFVSLGFCVKAQTDFAPVGAKWYYNYTNIDNPNPNYSYFLYESIGDSVIDGKKSRVVQYFSFDTKLNKLVKTSIIYYFYTTNNKVYLWDSSCKKFKILYDFNLNKGDTFKEYNLSGGCTSVNNPYIIVSEVRYFTINNVKLKQLDYSIKCSNNVNGATVMERIGNFGFNFIYRLGCFYEDCFANCGMRCYEDSVIGIFHNFDRSSDTIWEYKCDTVLLGIKTNENNQPEPISISPNPAHDFVTINSSENIKDIEVYDVVGKRMNIGKQNIVSLPYNINVSNFSSGLYFIEISTSDGVYRKKVVVQ